MAIRKVSDTMTVYEYRSDMKHMDAEDVEIEQVKVEQVKEEQPKVAPKRASRKPVKKTEDK